MSDTPLHDQPEHRDTFASVPTLFVWVAMQVGALGLAWSNAHLTAQGTPGAKVLGLKIMLITQLAGACLVFPGMLTSARSAAIAAAISFPLTQVAAQIAGAGAMAGLKASILVFIWIAGLTCWNIAFARQRMLLQALAMLWVFGAAIFVYLILEFRPRAALAEFLWDTSPLLMAGQFPDDTRLPGLLLVNLVLAVATLAGSRKWIGAPARRY